MIIFSGAQGQQMEQTVSGILQTFLEDKLAADPYLSRLAAWGGVSITTTSEDATRFTAAARPFIFIRPSGGGGSNTQRRELFRHRDGGVTYAGSRLVMEFPVELCVTERCRPAIAPLRDAVQSIIDTGYAELETLGLMETSITTAPESIQGAQFFYPHTFWCVAYSIPKPD